MAISEAKLAANRRNSQKSTGPRTDEGKRVSSLNPVTHGLRAKTLVLLDEDPRELDDRRVAWRDCLLPGDDVERRLVDSAVVHTWMEDRARRAQASRINANIINYGVDRAQTTAEEVVALGRRLFNDRLGPLVSYPTGSNEKGAHEFRNATTSFAGPGEDPDVPIDLVLRLQSTLLGCEWLLAEWARLKTILDEGQPWISSDKLKGVRLLGKQPFDAIDDKDVAMMFLASFVLNEHEGGWDWEIIIEMNRDKRKTFRKNAAIRQLDALKPSDGTKARQVLLEIIDRAAARLTEKAEAHRERARAMADLAPDLLAFDASKDGENLRRFELASGRALSRSLEDLRKHRRSPLSVGSGPKAVGSGSPSAAGCGAEAFSEATATNEPTAYYEILTDEPTDHHEILTNEPTATHVFVTNEPTADLEIATNESTATHVFVTNEPTDDHEIATNEPACADENASKHRDESGRQAENSPDLSVESEEQGVARRKARREETLRKLNEQARYEAASAMALRRASRRAERIKCGKRRGQPDGGAAGAGLGAGMENIVVGNTTEPDEFEKTALALFDEARAAPS